MRKPTGFWLTLFLVLAWAPALRAADPVVSNVIASQQGGTKLVNITFDVLDTDSDQLDMSVEISDDAGTTFLVPVSALSGDRPCSEISHQFADPRRALPGGPWTCATVAEFGAKRAALGGGVRLWGVGAGVERQGAALDTWPQPFGRVNAKDRPGAMARADA